MRSANRGENSISLGEGLPTSPISELSGRDMMGFPDPGTSLNRCLNMPDDTYLNLRVDASTRPSLQAVQKCGGVASFLLAVAFVVAPLIYLTGNLRDAFGPLAYDLGRWHKIRSSPI